MIYTRYSIYAKPGWWAGRSEAGRRGWNKSLFKKRTRGFHFQQGREGNPDMEMAMKMIMVKGTEMVKVI